jgi:hypothetical protein
MSEKTIQTRPHSIDLLGSFDYIDGIYYARNQRPVSYPVNGNEQCHQLEERSFWFQHRNKCISILVKHFSQNKTFWDIGGGNGFVSRHLQNQGVETVLLEPGQQGAQNAKSRGIDHIICGSLEDSGIKAGAIESAGMFDVLEHIEDDKVFLKKLHVASNQDAYLYLTVPAYNFLWSNDDKNAGHFRRYTLKQLSARLAECSFKVVYQTYFFSFLPIPVLLFRTIPSLLGLNKNSGNMKKHENEHSGFRLLALLSKICRWEQERIGALRSIALGGSCLVVAKKV